MDQSFSLKRGDIFWIFKLRNIKLVLFKPFFDAFSSYNLYDYIGETRNEWLNKCFYDLLVDKSKAWLIEWLIDNFIGLIDWLTTNFLLS